MPNSALFVSESRVIAADRRAIFDILADPAKHPLIDGSGSVRQSRPGGPSRLSLGVKFGMDMQVGAKYKIENTVVEFDEPGLIAWRHFNGHIWRYRLSDSAGGTLVVEEWDARPAQHKLFLRFARFGTRNQRGMIKTLQILDELVTPAAAAS